MATKSLYFKDVAPTGASGSRSLQDGGTAPTGALTTTGWTVAKLATPNLSAMLCGTKRASGTFTTADAIPSFVATACFRSENLLNGNFANTNWSLVFRLRCSLASSQTGAIKVRVWKSAAADGTGAVQLTSAVLTGTTTPVLSTTASNSSTVTWTPGGVMSFVEEYLWVQVEWSIVATAGSNSADAVIYVESVGVITTPDFAPGVDAVNFAVASAVAFGTATFNQAQTFGAGEFVPAVAGSPTFTAPAFAQVVLSDNIPDAVNLAVTGALSFGTPAAAAISNFTANDFAVAALALGTGALAQQHALPTPNNAAAGAPTFSVPVFTRIIPNDALTAVAVTINPPIFSTPTIVSGLQELLLGDYVIDNGLTGLGTADQMLLCSTQPATYVAAVASKLGTKALGAGNVFGPPAAAVGGRKATSVAISNGVVDSNGDAVCWVAVNVPNSRLLASGLIDIVSVNTVSAWGMSPVTVRMPSGA